MGQWEYKFITATFKNDGYGIDVVTCVDSVEIKHRLPVNEALKELGKDGWELAEVLSRSSNDSIQDKDLGVYILKRYIKKDYIGETSSTLAALRNPNPPPGVPNKPESTRK